MGGSWNVESPLLVGTAEEAAQAQAVAEEATQARGRPVSVVSVVSGGNGGWVEGREIRRFTANAYASLLRQEPVSEGRARRLRTEVDKLQVFCQIVQAAAAARDANGLDAVKLAAGRDLRDKFGGGSATSVLLGWLAELDEMPCKTC